MGSGWPGIRVSLCLPLYEHGRSPKQAFLGVGLPYMMNDDPSQVLTDITEQLRDLHEVEG